MAGLRRPLAVILVAGSACLLATQQAARAVPSTPPAITRTFFAELAGVGSTMWYSDDAGATWSNSTGVAPGALLDHESIGAGTFPAGALPHTGTDTVYYCAQNSFSGACGASLDGGI